MLVLGTTKRMVGTRCMEQNGFCAVMYHVVLLGPAGVN